MRFYAQAEVRQVSFEGRSDSDLTAIRSLEEEKVKRFALEAISEIKDMVFGKAKAVVEALTEKIQPKNLMMFDIDGTIAERKKLLSSSMISQIKELIKHGVLICINTGNMLDEENIARIVEPFKDCSDSFIIAANASTQIFYFESGVRREDLGYRKTLWR